MGSFDYDVVIVGAGPAGCECARQLASHGVKTALVEKVSDFKQNNFSSAGTPLETLFEFNLPESVVGSWWNEIKVVSTHAAGEWRAPKPLGVVMDFARLRSHLAETARKNGCEVLMGYRFAEFQSLGGQTLVRIEGTGQAPLSLHTKVLVDATGPHRSVLGKLTRGNRPYAQAVGLEYLIQTDPDSVPANQLQFLLGYRWVPQSGYGWVFPMERGTYKVGIGCLTPIKAEGGEGSLKKFLERILNVYLKLPSHRVLHQHGGFFKYTVGQRDTYYHQNVIGIGDSVSSVNPLGAEGIRHGMHSARIAAKHILKFLAKKAADFSGYEREAKRYFGLRWRLSEIFAAAVYTRLSDRWIDAGLRIAAHLSAEDIMDILFRYKFIKTLKLFRYGGPKLLKALPSLSFPSAIRK